MKKAIALLMVMIISACGHTSRDELFKIHTKVLVDETLQLSNDIPFDVTGRYKFHDENNYQMELIFDRAQECFTDITMLLVDNRQNDYKEPPLNFGYFNKNKINFIDETKEKNSVNQKAFRFTWYSDAYELTMKILFTYIKDKERNEIYLTYTNFTLYSEVTQ